MKFAPETSGSGITTSGVSGTTIAPRQTHDIGCNVCTKDSGDHRRKSKGGEQCDEFTGDYHGGGGIAATTHSVELSWAASTSAGIVGYNVYRAIGTGGYSRVDSSLVTGLKYTDVMVAAGTTYKDVVTAVDSVGLESTYSAAMAATVL